MKTRVIKANKGDEVKAAAEAARAVAAGKLVGFATETVYGLAALAENRRTMERLRQLKARPTRAFSIHLGRPQDVKRYVRDLSADARRLIEKAWPGPVTLLLPTGGRFPDRKLARTIRDSRSPVTAALTTCTRNRALGSFQIRNSGESRARNGEK